MKAMILAAGYGTRLRPLTTTLPKVMMPLCNRPLIDWSVEPLLRSDVRDLIVNLHHLPAPIESHLRAHFPGARFEFSFEPRILGTAGGVRKVRSLLENEGDFLLVNGDTAQVPDYERLLKARRAGDFVAALTLRPAPEHDRFTPVWYEDGFVTGFGAGRGEPLMFSGLHCISSRVFGHIPDRDFSGIVDDVYKPLLQDGRERIAAVIDDGPWFDIGTPRRYLEASRGLCRGAVVGARSVIKGSLRGCVVWDDCFIGRGVKLDSCIVAHGVELRETMHLHDAILCRDTPAIPRDPAYRFENGLVIASI